MKKVKGKVKAKTKAKVAALMLAVLALGVEPGVPAPQLGLERIASGLERPVAITHAGDGSGRLFITLQPGRVVIYDGSQVLATPFLDIAARVRCCGERGLLSIAFHPQYETNGRFFVNYTREPDGATVIAEYRVSDADPNVADPNSERVLLVIPQPYSNHNGGQLQFGPDGMLYIGMGDGGSAGDPQNYAQNPRSLLGKMLRIDVDGGDPYGIPPDNPFVGDDPEDVLDEVWALGLRNPWRFSFDRATGDLWIADVGQNAREEVNLQPASSSGGENYGWRIWEGSLCYNPPTGCESESVIGTLVFPVLEYPTSLGCAVTGGYRYRGGAIPDLYGYYVYGDYCAGTIWGALPENGTWTSTVLLETGFLISTFGEDEDGELYVANYSSSGEVYRLVGASGGTETAAVFRVTQGGAVLSDGAFYCGLPSGCFNAGVGADLAERIDTTEPVEPGDVVEIDPENPRRYRKSRGPYSPRAVGVIASAPGIVLGNRPEELRTPNPGRPLLALMGRVPVKATAENGPIRPGDLLTTASKPGYAMRCSAVSRCAGALLGKALSSLDTGTGWVEILLLR